MTGDFVYATDHEFGDPEFDEPLAEFCRDAAALVLDAHFTPDELPQPSRVGTQRLASVRRVRAANNAGGLWLFHHKPGRTDEQLVRIRTDARRVFSAAETASEGERLAL